MKNIFIVLLLCVFSMNVSAQKRTTTRNRVKQPTTLVTKAMADKIADFVYTSKAMVKPYSFLLIVSSFRFRI